MKVTIYKLVDDKGNMVDSKGEKYNVGDIAWVINDGPLHDRNRFWKEDYFLEVLPSGFKDKVIRVVVDDDGYPILYQNSLIIDKYGLLIE